jgi:hypothetical protein
MISKRPVLFLFLSFIFLLDACSSAANAQPVASTSTSLPEIKATETATLELTATNTPEPAANATEMAYATTFEAEQALPQIKFSGDADHYYIVTYDPTVWERIIDKNPSYAPISYTIKTKNDPVCSLTLGRSELWGGGEGMDESELPKPSYADLGDGLVFANLNDNFEGTHIVDYMLSKYEGKPQGFDNRSFIAKSLVGKWEPCRPLVRVVLATLKQYDGTIAESPWTE